MGKLSNMLYMIDLLNSGNIYTIDELSKKIGVTGRMIRYYKDEICNNGIAIESFKGPGGGYFMINKIKNYTSINKYDIQLLENSLIVLRKNKFKYVSKFEDLIKKMKDTYSIYDEKSKYIFNVDINCSDELEKILKDTISKNEKVEIIYNDINGNKSKRIIHPIHFFWYNGESYITAFCELRNDIRHFEIKRIINIK